MVTNTSSKGSSRASLLVSRNVMDTRPSSSCDPTTHHLERESAGDISETARNAQPRRSEIGATASTTLCKRSRPLKSAARIRTPVLVEALQLRASERSSMRVHHLDPSQGSLRLGAHVPKIGLLRLVLRL
eukprot:CAMPEP_0177542848 /NCGR_PEP_ID=MMETSP0369-20130122/61044_1 /TAXON_ID=447022 ORGANISM="Scrippsiella hangoei-like, Strain SHHI-4" /NCGR_SAMPLE_ID=MMETSP0369 /ASSEMBLY_ACC=CAM_ASM_000364 /LENGTH=129 /DNA_ID=CAMNT_0019026583 /DNA_START=114 /DNA_END=500 /DNA_ORIENTATION=+